MGAVAVLDRGGEHTYSGRGDAQLSLRPDGVVRRGKNHAHVSGDTAGGGGASSEAAQEFVSAGAVDGRRSSASRTTAGAALPADEPLRSHGEHRGGDVLRGSTVRRRDTTDRASDLEHPSVRAGRGY